MRHLILVCLMSFGFWAHAGLERGAIEGEYSYRGYTVHLNAHESKLIEFMLGRGGLQVYDADFARLMDWGLFSATRRTERLVAQLNHRMLMEAGAPILEHVRREGRIRFEFHPGFESPPAKRFKIQNEWHDIEGAERTILEVLEIEDLAQDNRNLFISEDKFRAIALSLVELTNHVGTLNERLKKPKSDSPFIKTITIHLLHDDYIYRFDVNKSEFKSQVDCRDQLARKRP